MQDYDEFQIKLTLKFRIPKEGITIQFSNYQRPGERIQPGKESLVEHWQTLD